MSATLHRPEPLNSIEENRDFPIFSGEIIVRKVRIAGHVQDIPLWLYRPERPATRPLPVIVYLHGGGFTADTCQDDTAAAAYLARHTPALVILVGYSLAPSHPFPTATYDAACAGRWAVAHGAEFGADGRRLGLAGFDAGGHIATSLALCNRDRGDLDLRALGLLAPLLDPSMTRMTPLTATVEDGDMLTRYTRCYSAYLPDAQSRLHPYATPLDCQRLVGLPATVVLTAHADLLHREAEKFACRLIDTGIPVEATRYSGVTHAGLSTHPPALAALADFFGRRLSPPMAGGGDVPGDRRVAGMWPI